MRLIPAHCRILPQMYFSTFQHVFVVQTVSAFYSVGMDMSVFHQSLN
jgi:hypothetical protein